MTEEEIIEENTAYMLGMYDLYHSDKEIIEALKLKGLTENIIAKILTKIKQPAYMKRIRQAKRMLGLSSLILIVF